MVSFQVDDMSCGHCVATITQALQRADPAAKIQITLPAHRVEIDSSQINAATAQRLIEEAGYTPMLLD
jgi:copper chaperone CopZ